MSIPYTSCILLIEPVGKIEQPRIDFNQILAANFLPFSNHANLPNVMWTFNLFICHLLSFFLSFSRESYSCVCVRVSGRVSDRFQGRREDTQWLLSFQSHPRSFLPTLCASLIARTRRKEEESGKEKNKKNLRSSSVGRIVIREEDQRSNGISRSRHAKNSEFFFSIFYFKILFFFIVGRVK